MHARTLAASLIEGNREADNWRPLLAIADAAGGEWPERARKATEMSHNAEGDEASRLAARGSTLPYGNWKAGACCGGA